MDIKNNTPYIPWICLIFINFQLDRYVLVYILFRYDKSTHVIDFINNKKLLNDTFKRIIEKIFFTKFISLMILTC